MPEYTNHSGQHQNKATLPAHKIPEDVETIQIWHLTAPVDVATCY